MAVLFSESKTKQNLMRAFAGEGQARNRYTFAAEQARKEGKPAIADPIHSRSGTGTCGKIL